MRRRVLFAPYDLRASRASTTSAACSSSSTTSFTVSGICPAGSKALRRLHLGENPFFRRRPPAPRQQTVHLELKRPHHDQRAQPDDVRSQSLPHRRRKSRSWPKGPAVKTGVPTVASGLGLEELTNTRASRRVELRPTRRGQNAAVVRWILTAQQPYPNRVDYSDN